MTLHRILVLRPYGRHIRERMFATLARLGLEPGSEDILSSSLSDEEIIEQLGDRKSELLLCPYNNLTLPDGRITNGLRLLQQIEQASLDHLADLPVLMPVSVFSAPLFQSELRQGNNLGRPSDGLISRILVIHEDTLDDQETLAARIRTHCAKVRRRSSGAAIR